MGAVRPAVSVRAGRFGLQASRSVHEPCREPAPQRRRLQRHQVGGALRTHRAPRIRQPITIATHHRQPRRCRGRGPRRCAVRPIDHRDRATRQLRVAISHLNGCHIVVVVVSEERRAEFDQIRSSVTSWAGRRVSQICSSANQLGAVCRSRLTDAHQWDGYHPAGRRRGLRSRLCD